MRPKFGLFVGLIMLMAVPAYAGHCHQFFVQKVVAVPVAVAYVQPSVYYSSGQAIERKALVEEITQSLYQRLITPQQQTTGQSTPYQNPVNGYTNGQSPQGQRTVPNAPKTNALVQHCSKCHSGNTPKGRVSIDGKTEIAVILDGNTPVPSQVITQSLREVRDETMPKGHKLTPEQKGDVMNALLEMEVVQAKEEQPVPVPQPGEDGILR